MNWASVILALQQMDPIVAAMATAMIIFFLYRSGINIIPKLKKKNKSATLNGLLDIHRTCPNFSSVSVILERVMEKSEQIFRIRYQDTLYEQMVEAELLWESTKDAYKENFRQTFEAVNPNISKNERIEANRGYALILDSLETDMLGIIRRWMKKNHFMNKTDIEYEVYIEEKTRLLGERLNRLFEYKYDEDVLQVPREILTRNRENMADAKIVKEIHILFIRARAISTAKTKLISGLQAEIAQV